MIDLDSRDPADALAMVFRRVQQVVGDLVTAEDAAVAATARYLTRSGPDWLRAADDGTRLDVLTCVEVLRLRR